MQPKDVKAHIRQAATSFDAELHTEAYAQTHFDDAQLGRLLSYLKPGDDQFFLDLGTGSGYVAMSIAEAHPNSRVLGLDVAEQAIRRDAEVAATKGVSNISFDVFDGVTLPFSADYFDGVVCRYAFHHLPRCEITLGEISRVTRSGGVFVLADAVRNDEDETDFINDFQLLKQDGHVRMHRSNALLDLVCRHGFELVDRFDSSISFSRERADEYDDLLASTPEAIKKSYSVNVAEDEIHMTFKILNAAFLNRSEQR